MPVADWVNQDAEEFNEYVKDFHTQYLIDPDTNCWIWTSTIDNKGKPKATYSAFIPCSFSPAFLAWSFIKGEPIYIATFSRTCKNVLCINPDHWIFVTKTDQEDKIKRIKVKGKTKSIKEIAMEEEMSYQAVWNLLKSKK